MTDRTVSGIAGLTGEGGGTVSRKGLRLIVLPLLLAAIVISAQVLRKPLHAPHGDEFYYLTIARDLALHGVFTDGMYKRGPFLRGEGPELFGDESPAFAKPGRFFAPLYPMFVRAAMALDSRLDASVRCHVRGSDRGITACPSAFATLVGLQILLWALAALVVFRMAFLLGGSEVVAWLAMLIALASGEPAYYARTYLSESVTVPAFCGFMLFAVQATQSGRITDYLGAGLFLGAASMARPAYAYLFYLLALLLPFALLLGRRREGWPRPGHATAFLLAGLGVMAPWMIRNLAVFGDLSLSRGYAEVILLQRVSYNRMSWAEWGVAWIYWLPDFGDEIAKLLFQPHLYQRLGWTVPDTYYLDGGSGAFREAVLRQTGSDAAVMGLILRTYLLGDIVKHVMVTLPLTMRGLGVAKYLSVAGVILFWPVLCEMRRRGMLAPFLALVMPPLLMAGLHGFVSINIDRYNLPMLAVYAVIVAQAAALAMRRWREAHH